MRASGMGTYGDRRHGAYNSPAARPRRTHVNDDERSSAVPDSNKAVIYKGAGKVEVESTDHPTF